MAFDHEWLATAQLAKLVPEGVERGLLLHFHNSTALGNMNGYQPWTDLVCGLFRTLQAVAEGLLMITRIATLHEDTDAP